MKLLLSNNLQSYNFHSFNNSYIYNYFYPSQWQKKCILETLTKPASFYRKFCIQYLTEQWIKNNSQGKWISIFNKYIQNLIQNEKESIKELCITLTKHKIDPVFLSSVGTIDKLTLRLEEINSSILENMEILLNACIEYRINKTKTPLEINFDIKWNKKSLLDKNENKRREENMIEIIHLIYEIFNKKLEYQSSSQLNKKSKL